MNQLKIKNNFIYTIFVSMMFISLSSCEKETTNDENNNQYVINEDVEVINGYLAFKSKESYIAITDSISYFSDTERAEWEESIGFESQRNIVTNVIQEEMKADSINELKYKNVDISNIDINDTYSEAYKTALEKGIIKLIDPGTEDEYWDYAVFNKTYIDFINEDGLFAIGDTLYQVTNTCLKIMKNADLNNPQALLNANEPTGDIEFEYFSNTKNLKATSPGMLTCDWVTSGKKRIKLEVYLAVRYYTSGSMAYEFYHDCYVQCMEKNWLGKWKYHVANTTVTGEWVLHVYYKPQEYESSWSWSGSCSYLKASINPGTGTSAVYQSTFIVTPNTANKAYSESWQYNYQPCYNSCTWEASRTNGTITATITR